MGTVDRRNSMTLDEISLYWRKLRAGETANVNKLCNCITTVDLVFQGELSESFSQHLSQERWTRIRNELFNFLITSFSGYFVVVPQDNDCPLDNDEDWPESGVVEFWPASSNRKTDIIRAPIEAIDPAIVLSLRWCAAEGRHQIEPDDFKAYREAENDTEDTDEASEARELIDSLCQICVDEAQKSKRIAHRTWWRLSSEASSCPDKRRRQMLKRQLGELESIWGVPSA